ncbi:MAG: ABC transporter ATP-binding protein [Alphaproteobacteria bacterium]
MAEAAIELNGVSKSFGRNKVLDGVHLEVRRGEIVGLLGPNGSGKTTTLRIIAGYIAPDGGIARVCGGDSAATMPGIRAKIGYFPERPPLYDPLTVVQYLDFVGAAKGIAPNGRSGAIDKVVDAFWLGEVRDKIVGRLSKGYRQRLGLAQAMLGDPEVLLLDEPTNGLDPLQIQETRELIRIGGAGRAVIFSTHIMQEVAALCSRVVVLNHGQVVTVDRPVPDGEGQIVDLDLAGIPAERAKAVFAALPDVAAVEFRDPAPADVVRLRCTARVGGDIRAAVARAAVGAATLLEMKCHVASFEERFIESISEVRHDQDAG